MKAAMYAGLLFGILSAISVSYGQTTNPEGGQGANRAPATNPERSPGGGADIKQQRNEGGSADRRQNDGGRQNADNPRRPQTDR